MSANHVDFGMQDPSSAALTDANLYVSAGEVVAGKYRVDSLLGVGGMAFVVSAKHVDLEERFALKFLNEQFSKDRTIIERFTQEAKAACRIRSEHVARVYDVGTHRGAPYLVMEHLNGRDLATVVAQSGPLRIEDAVEYTMQACEALAVAHRQGIIHRDIKPENLFLVEHDGLLPVLKVLDFGISKLVLAGGTPASRLTGDLTLGTPSYMSPEQIRSSASADQRSDLWSLGVVLYELLAGIEAFRGPSITEVCAAVLEREPQPLWELRPDVPHELAEIVTKCIKKDPEDRFANVAELAVALLPFAPSRALVLAERSSSLMRSTRPSAPPTQYLVLSGDSEPPPSQAALARSLNPASATSRFRAHLGSIALMAVTAMVVAALVVLVYPIHRKSVEARSSSAAARPGGPELDPTTSTFATASAPVAIRATTTFERPVQAGPIASAPHRRVTPTPPPRVRQVAAQAPTSPHASTVAEAPSSRSPAPVPTPQYAPVELGY